MVEAFGSKSSSGAAEHHHPRRQLSSPTTVHHHAITTRPPALSEPPPLRLISPAYSSSPTTASLVDHLHFRLSPSFINGVTPATTTLTPSPSSSTTSARVGVLHGYPLPW
ncbi:hypothetical protein U1Q18_028247 [Sarracenia purpurea var. burkii]